MKKTFHIRSGETVVATVTVEAPTVKLGGDYPADTFIRAFDASGQPVFCASKWSHQKTLTIEEVEDEEDK